MAKNTKHKAKGITGTVLSFMLMICAAMIIAHLYHSSKNEGGSAEDLIEQTFTKLKDK